MKSIGYLWISSILLPWSAVSGHPCNIDKMGRAACSGKSLLHPPNFLPRHITILDLSFNSLMMPKYGPFLRSFPSLHSLNLSSNSIPTLSPSLFCNLGALRLLDLSNCDISHVHRMSFRGLKSLHSLHLNNNKLQSLDLSIFPASGILAHLDLQNNELPCRHELIQLNVQRIHHIKLQGNPSVCSDSLSPFQQAVPGKEELQIQEIRTSDYEIVSHRRKLQFLHIGATKKPSSLENATAAITTPSTQTAGKNWIYFAGFVLLAIILSLLIALIVKCKLLHKKHASYHHQRLPDSRSIGSSHIEEGDMGMAYGRNQPISGASECYPEDDDGFIEDNYIVSNQELKEEEEDLELEPHFKVGRSF
ncbi:PREDICTED: leucine-rich repeat-containing protein 19-like isoform X1 [Thamnophis sirtalis]|uniref:Leucine-rich repeat-containing protein 19-like isoform X1 n=1 Tax=Thamnophis sirtalis TaxID=35019 RepID=A0A6I9XSN7_9SAUR|nr:PREDICTED: leucine-rich repeat-containing protein 19-like isoform X1 [Thamnophis sirtalis]XP_013917097.1 PREDICTED: leucine-rich repeat-containing protein 19-like isoform X1 [Thamnophis sirtalis]